MRCNCQVLAAWGYKNKIESYITNNMIYAYSHAECIDVYICEFDIFITKYF